VGDLYRRLEEIQETIGSDLVLIAFNLEFA